MIFLDLLTAVCCTKFMVLKKIMFVIALCIGLLVTAREISFQTVSLAQAAEECGSAGCCVKDKGGKCQYTNNSCSGSYVSNYCPRGNNYKCCVSPKTQLAIPSAFLHIIGKAGDSIKEGEDGGGNPDPKHETREVTINITDQNNNPKVSNKTATLTFDSTLGAFKTTTPIDLGNLPTGSYKVTIKMPMSLPLTLPNNLTLTSGKSTDLPTVYLVTGDIKDDGKLDMLDWNILRDCFSDIEDPSSCSDETKKLKADITDDGEVNHPDVNVWIRECKENC